MINATLTMTRLADDGEERYRKYFLIADFASQKGYGNASIIPMSQGAPMPTTNRFTIKGGEDEALLSVIDILRNLQGNVGFSAAINLNPN